MHNHGFFLFYFSIFFVWCMIGYKTKKRKEKKRKEKKRKEKKRKEKKRKENRRNEKKLKG